MLHSNQMRCLRRRYLIQCSPISHIQEQHPFLNTNTPVKFHKQKLVAQFRKKRSVSNNSQCQITRIRAIARARSRKSLVRRCLFISSRLGLRLGLIIPTCRANLVLRAIWQYEIFGMQRLTQ